jgi:hypothetical protein
MQEGYTGDVSMQDGESTHNTSAGDVDNWAARVSAMVAPDRAGGAGEGEIYLGDTSLCVQYAGAANPLANMDPPHLQCLNILRCPAEIEGWISSVTLFLGAKPPGDGKKWEVRAYGVNLGGSEQGEQGVDTAVLFAKQSIEINPYTVGHLQVVHLNPPLRIAKGQFPAILNRDMSPDGKGLEIVTKDGGHCSCWRSMELPPDEAGVPVEVYHRTRMVGWYATFSRSATPAAPLGMNSV